MGGQLRTPKLSLAAAGGGGPPLVTLSLLLRFFLYCGFPKYDSSYDKEFKIRLISCVQYFQENEINNTLRESSDISPEIEKQTRTRNTVDEHQCPLYIEKCSKVKSSMLI